MKKPLLTALTAGFATLVITSSVLFWLDQRFALEAGFCPSPNGRWIASRADSFTGSCIRIRNLKGRSVWKIPLSYGSRSSASTIWSPDGGRLAILSRPSMHMSPSALALVDVQKRQHWIADAAAASPRWKDPSRLFYLRSEAVFSDGPVECVEYDVTARLAKEGRSLGIAHAFHPAFSSDNNQFSPTARHLILATEEKTTAFDLSSPGRHQDLVKKMSTVFCWWSPDGASCLISGLCSAPAARLEDIHLTESLVLYRPDAGSFDDLSDGLARLKEPGRMDPRPMAENQVWSERGDWFLAGNGNKQWICVPDPWSTLCLQGIDAGFCNAQIAPKGRLVAAMTVPSPRAQGDLYVFEVQVTKAGVQHSTPVRVASAKSTTWFWTADGSSILVRESGRFRRCVVPGIRPLRPARPTL